MKLTPEGSFVITGADRATCLGSDELKDCPFCGERPISCGRVNEESGNYVHDVLCPNEDCQAHVFSCQNGDKQKEAREVAIAKWNRRA